MPEISRFLISDMKYIFNYRIWFKFDDGSQGRWTWKMSYGERYLIL
jgi:hypothetical protein